MKSRASQPRVTSTVFQIRLPAAEKRRNWPRGIRTTPAGTEMKLRTIGTIRPRKTAERPCFSNHAKVLSTSSVSTSGSRSRKACERRGAGARPGEEKKRGPGGEPPGGRGAAPPDRRGAAEGTPGAPAKGPPGGGR